MVLLESMYFGLPAITTLNGGSSTLVKNNENGFICELKKEEWCKCINKIISDGELRNNISCNCTKEIVEKYTWDKLADKFFNIYKNVMVLKEKDASK